LSIGRLYHDHGNIVKWIYKQQSVGPAPLDDRPSTHESVKFLSATLTSELRRIGRQRHLGKKGGVKKRCVGEKGLRKILF